MNEHWKDYKQSETNSNVTKTYATLVVKTESRVEETLYCCTYSGAPMNEYTGLWETLHGLCPKSIFLAPNRNRIILLDVTPRNFQDSVFRRVRPRANHTQ